jgi:hypothetical protein
MTTSYKTFILPIPNSAIPACPVGRRIPQSSSWKIALEIHRLFFVNVGSLISNHGDAGIFIKVVFVIFAAMVDEQILFFINQL